MLPRSFAWDKLILTLAAVPTKVVAPPVAVKGPVCVIFPAEVNVKFWPTLEVPSVNAVISVTLTSLAPLLLKLTAPTNVLFCVKVIGLAPALKLESPKIVNPPVCVIAPVTVAVKLLPIDDAASTKGMVLLTLILFVPVLVKLTAPVNALACVKVIGKLPVVKLEVPGIVSAASCVIAPPAVTFREPPLCKAPPGKVIGALSNTIVKLVKFINPGAAGKVAPAFTLRTFILRTFARLPAKMKGTAPRSLANGKIISEFGAVKDMVLVPDTVSTLVCVTLPPTVKTTLRPIVEGPITKPMLLVTFISLAPLLLALTAPVNTLF